MSTRAQLEADIKKYKESLEASKGLPDAVTDNNIKYNSSTGRLEYDMPDNLDENKFDENLPENQAKDKVFIKYQISKYTQRGRDFKGNNKVLGFVRSTKDETRMLHNKRKESWQQSVKLMNDYRLQNINNPKKELPYFIQTVKETLKITPSLFSFPTEKATVESMKLNQSDPPPS